MAVDYPKMCEKVFQRYPFFRSSASERQTLFKRGSDRHLAVMNLPKFPFERATVV
jgi:hypothetical protein